MSTRVGALALAVAAIVAGPSLATSSSEGDGRGPRPDAHTRSKYQAKSDQRERERKSPAEGARRRRSRTAFEGQSDRGAYATAHKYHRRLFEEPIWNPVPAGSVERFLGENTARVAVDGRSSIVVSSLPLRARTATGGKKLIDLRLKRRGGHFASRNPLVPVSIGKRANRGFRFEDTGIRISPVVARGAAPARLADDKLFYPNVDTDTDLVAMPQAAGVETFLVLRSAASPERSSLRFDLPAGTTLREDPSVEGAVEVVRDDRRLLTLHPPQGWDADGEPFRVSYAVKGNVVVMRFPHRDDDLKYPLVVDPLAAQGFYDNVLNYPTWDFRDSPVGIFDNPWQTGDLAIQTNASRAYGNGYYGVWYYVPQGVAYAWRLDAWTNLNNGNASAALYEGLWSPTNGSNGGWWQVAWGDNYGRAGVVGPSWTYDSLSGHFQEHCILSGCNPAGGWSHAGTQAAVGLVMTNVDRFPGYQASVHLYGASVYVDDPDSPVVETPTVQPSGWADSGTVTVSARSTDGGLGIKYQRFDVPSMSAPGGSIATSRTHGCDGLSSNRCPAAWGPGNPQYTSFTASAQDMPEGVVNGSLRAYDLNGHSSSVRAVPVKVDRSPPSALNPSGALYQPPGGWLKEGSHHLTLQPTDAYSGVRSSELQMKPGPSGTDGFTRNASGGWGTADLGGPWSIVGDATRFSVDGSRGRIAAPQDAPQYALLASEEARDVDVKAEISYPELPGTGAQTGWLVLRRQGDGGQYRVGLVRDGLTQRLSLRGEPAGALFAETDTGLSYEPGARYNVRARIVGDGSPDHETRVRMRVWKAGTPEPTSWTVDGIDQESVGPQAAGVVGLAAESSTPGDATFAFDELIAVDLDRFRTLSTRDDGCGASGCNTSPTHQFDWQTSGYPEGAYEFRAIAKDPLAYSGGAPELHTLTGDPWRADLDRKPPEITDRRGSLASENGAIRRGANDLAVAASDSPSGLGSMEAFVSDADQPGSPRTSLGRKDCTDPEDSCPAFTGEWRWDSSQNAWDHVRVTVEVTDKAGNAGPAHTWEVWVDDDKPTAPVITGTLRDAENKAVSGTAFTLHVEAADGTLANPSSGVKQIKLLVGPDGDALTERQASPTQDCAAGNCTQTWDTTFDPLPSDESRAPRRIRVRVIDQAGNTSDVPVSYSSLAGQWRLNETSGTTAADSAPRSEEVPNPSFEADTSGWVSSAGYFLAASSTLSRQVEEGAPDGAYVAKVVTPAAQSAGIGTDVTVRAGQRYRVRVKLKREAGGAGLRIAMGEMAAPNEELVVNPGATPGSTGYTEYTGVVTPSRSGTYRLYVRTANNPSPATTFYVDAASVKEENPGTYTGGYTLGEPGGTTDGDKAVKLDGSSGYVAIPDAEALDLGDSLSIEAWFKRSSASGDQMLVSKGQNSYLLWITGGKLTLRKSQVGDIVQATTTPGADGAWHHVVATKNGASAKIYLDGVDVSGPVTNQTLANNSQALKLGNNVDVGNWNGWLDDVGLYSTALSATEVAQRYSGRAYDWNVVFDNGAPTLHASDPPSDTVWHNGSASFETTLTGHDSVSGVKRLKLFTPKQGGGEDVQTHDDTSCSESITNLCPTDPPARTITYSTAGMSEGADVTVRTLAEDAAGNTSDQRTWKLKVDRSPPEITLSDDLATLDLDESGRDLYGLHIDVRDGVRGGAPGDQRSGVQSISILTDGQEDEAFEADPECEGDSCPLVADYVLDTDWFEQEGTHTIEVVATDRLGHESRRTLTIRVPRDNHYAAKVAEWKSTVERRVDDATPVVPLTGPMPAVPDRWRNAAACESSTTAMHDCYDAGMRWARDVRAWLEENLAGVTKPDLPEMPTYEYHPEIGTARDLTRRLRDAFEFAERTVRSPTDVLNVAIGFHDPVPTSTLTGLVPNDLQGEISLTGIFDPGGADINGSKTLTGPIAISSVVESFNNDQIAILNEDIAEIEQEQPEDAMDAEDIQDELDEMRAARTHLQERRPFVKGVSLRLSAAFLTNALADNDVLGDIKAIAIVPDPTPEDEGLNLGRTALEGMSTDAGAVAAADDEAVAGADDEADVGVSAAASPRQQTCGQKGQGTGRANRKTLDPNPLYYAPSRLKYDTARGREDGDHHQKVHRLRFKWNNGEGLAWMCGDKRGERGIEMEARVYPDDDERWSVNWEDKDVGDTVTQNDMPEPIHQDDLACGPRCYDLPDHHPTEKNRYPDFAILSQSAWKFKYRELYRLNFRTDEGHTDGGRVIYNAQAIRRELGGREGDYCHDLRNDHYQSCMFSTTTACYDHEHIPNPPGHRKVDWSTYLGEPWSLRTIERLRPEQIDGDGDVRSICDGRPPGHNRR